MELQIESHEGGIYLASYGENDNWTYVTGDAKSRQKCPQRFSSIVEVKDALGAKQFDQVWLKQQTAYDEMIGLNSREEETRINLHW